MSYPTFDLNDTKTTTASASFTDLDFVNDYVEVPTSKPNETLYAYIKGSNVDQAHSVRIAKDDVKNVYANTGIQPGLIAPVKNGATVLISTRMSYRTEPTTGVLIDYPIQVGNTFKYPIVADVTPVVLSQVIKRNFSVLLTGSGTSVSDRFYDRLGKLMRGALRLI